MVIRIKCKDYSDEHGPIQYGLQFGRQASRPAWQIIESGDDLAARAIMLALSTFGGNLSTRAKLADSVVTHLVRSAKDQRSDAWVGWRFMKAMVQDMPDASAEDYLWFMLIESRIKQALEEGSTP